MHEPQLRMPPQPFETVPQFSPAGQLVAGVQPQTFGVPPPPQVCEPLQLPQLIVPPQPFAIVPQLSPAGQAVMGVQPHWLTTPAPPHV